MKGIFMKAMAMLTTATLLLLFPAEAKAISLDDLDASFPYRQEAGSPAQSGVFSNYRGNFVAPSCPRPYNLEVGVETFATGRWSLKRGPIWVRSHSGNKFQLITGDWTYGYSPVAHQWIQSSDCIINQGYGVGYGPLSTPIGVTYVPGPGKQRLFNSHGLIGPPLFNMKWKESTVVRGIQTIDVKIILAPKGQTLLDWNKVILNEFQCPKLYVAKKVPPVGTQQISVPCRQKGAQLIFFLTFSKADR